MSLQIADNFSYQGKKPLDTRITCDTLAQMLALPSNTIYDGILVYLKEDKKYYVFDSSNTPDPQLGLWKEFAGGGSSEALVFSDLSAFPQVGDSKTLYIAEDQNSLYRYDEIEGRYTALSSTGGISKQYSHTIVGNNNNSYTISHNLNTYKLLITIYDAATLEHVPFQSRMLDLNTVEISWGDKIPANVSYQVEIIGW